MTPNEQFFTSLQHRIQLNEVQKQAVEHDERPLLLLASPGSGKTTTIITRIAYLMQVKHYEPQEILAVSFSKASAQDLLRRFNTLFPELIEPQFSTIHSLAYKVMRSYLRGQQKMFHIIEGSKDDLANTVNQGDTAPYKYVTKLKLLSSIYEQINAERPKEEQLEELTTFISLIKNKCLKPSQWSSIPCEVPQAIKIVEKYEWVKQHQYDCLLIDYDDMLTLALEAFETEPQILKFYQQQYAYVLTDESQDTSIVQHKIIEWLVMPHQRLFVVADDDQAIYSWRGADVNYLLEFKQHYPKAEVLFLQQNYRSTKHIVRAANYIIKQNKSRYAKVMVTENDEGKAITIRKFTTGYQEVSFIADHIQQQKQLSEIAVLYRNHLSNILLINELDKRSIPFYMKDADDRFFKHWVIQDILNIFRLSYSDKHFHVFEAVAMKLQLYLSFDHINRLKQVYNGEPLFDWLATQVKLEPYQQTQLEKLKSIVPELKNVAPKLAIVQIREKIGYNKVIKQLSERVGFKYDYLMSILDSLELIADGLETLVQFVDKLKHLEQLQRHARKESRQQAVTLSTLHSAKGLEFDTVFMMDLNEGVIPSRQDTEKVETMEEAVRLFYVGMTRARHTLYLLSVEQYFGQSAMDSRFVRQLNKLYEPSKPATTSTINKTTNMSKPKPVRPSFIDGISNPALLTVNTRVEHQEFGQGTITAYDGQKVHVAFDSAGSKVLLVSIVLERGILRIIPNAR